MHPNARICEIEGILPLHAYLVVIEGNILIEHQLHV